MSIVMDHDHLSRFSDDVLEARGSFATAAKGITPKVVSMAPANVNDQTSVPGFNQA